MSNQIHLRPITQEQEKNYAHMFLGWKENQRNSLNLRQSYNRQKNQMEKIQYIKPPVKCNNDQSSIFQQYATEIINYLKAKFIVEEVIEQFEQYKLIDLTQQKSIQFMHLICFRAWCDINSVLNVFLPLNFNKSNSKTNNTQMTMNENMDQQSLKVLVTQMFKLGEKIQKIFQLYHKILSFREKKFTARLKSFLDYIFHNAQKNERDNILFGVEGVNFTREKQLQYTQKNLIPIIRKRLLDKPGINSSKMRNKLLAYPKIMCIQFQKLESFDDFQVLKKTIIKQVQINLKLQPILH